MKVRHLLSLAVLACSLIYSPGGTQVKDENTPKMFDGTGGRPCTDLPPLCPQKKPGEPADGYLASNSSTSERVIAFHTRAV